MRFECIGCGYCCGCEPGYVFLSEEDVLNLQKHFNIDFQTLLERYLRVVDMGSFYYLSLMEKKNNDCIFLNNKRCDIYEARPIQCRTYPFWPSVIENWEEEKKSCPGIGKGPKLNIEYVKEQADKKINNHYKILKKDVKLKKFEKNHRSFSG